MKDFTEKYLCFMIYQSIPHLLCNTGSSSHPKHKKYSGCKRKKESLQT
uniref:Uncharacterized protein n=1 Tax=Rhizophora mucronata TaxID=61149 RepID=A0A2P2JQ06_RHIMU